MTQPQKDECLSILGILTAEGLSGMISAERGGDRYSMDERISSAFLAQDPRRQLVRRVVRLLADTPDSDWPFDANLIRPFSAHDTETAP
jgi:hypothetical protein